MSRWHRGDWYDRPAKKPPPERGLRMKQAGATWWGQRWLGALESVLRGDAARLARGRTYARAGRVHDLVLQRGQVTARVTGSAPKPYTITIALAQLTEMAWQKAITAMARRAQFSAALLAGQMPQAIDEAFLEAGTSLFPAARKELDTKCSCPDWGDPCKHVAAAHYLLGEALDRDPFLLFELRGRNREEVLTALRTARDKAAEATPQRRGKTAGATPQRRGKTAGATPTPRSEAEVTPQDTAAVLTVRLGQLSATEYDTPRQPLPALRLRFDEPGEPGAVLRQLGAPATWERDETPAEVLAPLVHAAARAARRIAMAEPADAGPAPPPPAPEARGRRSQRPGGRGPR